jgi:DNA-binding response OmpR family regulator
MKNRILVIDDDSGILEVVKIILEDHGFEVIILNNAMSWEDSIKEAKPDLILLDLWMPGIDGGELCTKIKKMEGFKKIPLIMLSASAYTEKVSTTCGANDYLTKPFELSDLLDVVKRNLKDGK